ERFAAGAGQAPAPFPLVQVIGGKNGPLIEQVRWLTDSSGIAFTQLVKSARSEFHRLFLADINTHAVKPLTPEDQDTGEFDIRSPNRFVYSVSAPTSVVPAKEPERTAVALTGKSFWSIIFPNTTQKLSPFEDSGLWAFIDGNRRRVLDASAYATERWGVSLS